GAALARSLLGSSSRVTAGARLTLVELIELLGGVGVMRFTLGRSGWTGEGWLPRQGDWETGRQGDRRGSLSSLPVSRSPCLPVCDDRPGRGRSRGRSHRGEALCCRPRGRRRAAAGLVAHVFDDGPVVAEGEQHPVFEVAVGGPLAIAEGGLGHLAVERQ